MNAARTSGLDGQEAVKWACFVAPLLIGVETVAALWVENAQQVTIDQVARTLAFVALLAVAGPTILHATRVRSLFSYNLFTLLLYVALHWRDFKQGARHIDALLAHGKLLAYLTFALLAVALIFWARLRSRGFAKFALLFSALLLATTLVRMPSLAVAPTAALPHLLPSPPSLPLDRAPAAAGLPDIIYIVPDRYGGPGVLKEFFGFDNHRFVEALRSRGFYVATEARANYLKTFQSLASSLNMQHLDHLSEVIGPESNDERPVYQLIRNNLVTRLLKDLGYEYLHVGSWWEPTRHNPAADVAFYGSVYPVLGALSEFDRALLDRTVIEGPVEELEEKNECLRLKRQLEFLKTAGDPDRPTFLFAHLTIPHTPITMDAQGRCIEPIEYPQENVSWQDFQRAYASYVSYLNSALLAIFDARIETSRRPLVFVIQADEGPFPKRYRELEKRMNWFEATDDELRMKYGIMNAVYLPDRDYRRFYETLTPVNNFRLIFSNILDVDLPLLPDRSFVLRDENHVYDFREVPPQVHSGRSAQ